MDTTNVADVVLFQSKTDNALRTFERPSYVRSGSSLKKEFETKIKINCIKNPIANN